MKKCFFFICLMVLGYNVFCQSEENQFTVQTNITYLLCNILFNTLDNSAQTFFIMDIEGQYRINDSFNFSLTLSLLNSNYSLYDEENILELSMKPMLVWRPFKTGIRGFYLGLFPSIGIISYKNSIWEGLSHKKDSYLLAEIGCGGSIGYKWVLKKGFTMQLGCTFEQTFIVPKEREYSDSYNSLMTFINIISFKMGYTF